MQRADMRVTSHEVSREERSKFPQFINKWSGIVSPLLDCSEVPREERPKWPQFMNKWQFRDPHRDGRYLTAAFRSSRKDEVYIFIHLDCVLVNYTPSNNTLLEGPNLVCKGSPTVAFSQFCDCGITCALGTHYENKAYIFSGSSCAYVEYAHGTTNLVILREGTICQIFPFLVGTPFENFIDSGFESSTIYEAYIFRKDKYARINYRDGCLISIEPTFNCLRNTIFESRVDAAFASHRTDEAYVFNGEYYAIINFAGDYITGGVKKITADWNSLNGILPCKKNFLDDHDHGARWSDEESSDEDEENSDEDEETADENSEDLENADENSDEDHGEL